MTATPLPAAGYFNGAITNAQAKDAQDAILAFLRQSGLGNYAESTLTLASDIITPTTGVHAIETQASASADNCTNIAVTNMIDGQLLLVRAANASHVVTLKHGSGGSGQLSLKGSADAVLDATDKWVLLKLTSTTWEEVFRSWTVDNSRFCGATGGTANAITVTPTQPLTTYTGSRLTMLITTTNTTEAVTINPSALGVVNIKQRRFGVVTNPGIGQLLSGTMVSVDWDGTQYIIENPGEAESAALTAASTLDLTAAAVTGNSGVLGGTTAVTAITMPRGMTFEIYHNALTPFTHGASLVCLSGASITTAVGDISRWRGFGNVVYMVSYQLASGRALVEPATIPSGSPAQAPVRQRTATYTAYTGAHTLVQDDTAPTTSETEAILSATSALTCQSTSNYLRVEGFVTYDCSSSGQLMIFAVFRDSETDAYLVFPDKDEGNNSLEGFAFSIEIPVPDTSAHTYTLRAGSSGGNIYINGDNTGRFYAGKCNTYLKVTEIKA